MRVIMCDKCGCIIDTDDAVVLGIRNLNLDEHKRYDHVDLCKDCGQSFRAWFMENNPKSIDISDTIC